MTRLALGIVAALALAAVFPAAPAQAQNGSLTRSFVSSAGNDGNPCTITQPCQSFAQAYTKVGANGIVAALDPGKYGPLYISTGVTINGNGWAAITGPSGGSAIVLEAYEGGPVVLRGLLLDGQGVSTDGIFMDNGGDVEIVDCEIRNFSHDGIEFNVAGDTTNAVVVLNTIASYNGSAGIEMTPIGGEAGRGVFNHVTTVANGGSGLLFNGTLDGGGGFVDVQISNAISDSNGGDGLTAEAVGNMKLDVRNSIFSNNIGNGLSVSNAKVSMSNNSLVLNAAGFSNTNSGTLYSFGDNVIENNRGASTGALTADSKQ
jgi:parallel beta helix pectate lyase-like protein